MTRVVDEVGRQGVGSSAIQMRLHCSNSKRGRALARRPRGPHLVVAQREGVQADVVEEEVGHVVAVLGVGVVPRRARELVTCAWMRPAG